MKDLSVIITSCDEYPQNLLTTFNLMEELKDYDYEILLVDNNLKEDIKDRTRSAFDGVPAEWKDRIKWIPYKEKQSHALAKNYGYSKSQGRNILFLDAHVIMGRGALPKMIEFLDNFKGKIGSVHALLRWGWYKDGLPCKWKFSKEKFGSDLEIATEVDLEQIPIASTCGMMIKREVTEELGLFNENIGVYMGNEPYLTLKLATCGYPLYRLDNSVYFWHYFYREKKYEIPENDTKINRMIAAYCIGGEEWLDKEKPDEVTRLKIISENKKDREFIKLKQVTDLNSYLKQWI